MDRRDRNPGTPSGGSRPPRRQYHGRGYPLDNHDAAPPADGRLPEIYYRRRRAAAVIAIIVVAVIVVAVLSLVGRDSDTTATSATSSVTTSAASATSSSAVAESSTSSSSAPSSTSAEEKAVEISSAPSGAPEPTDELSAKSTCEITDLQLEASADHPNYSPDGMPSFYMKVRNPTGADCEIDISQNTLRFEVYSLETNQRIWSDIDCNDPAGVGTQTFKAGQERYFRAQWSRTTSSPDGCSVREPVAPGSYYLHTVIGDNASAPFDFNLQ
ncbi:MAG: hypothetical protein Q4D85_01375 [Corynebacterium sp.]|uniref:hypothetical protein n=1 Tax=Corynebacterium sp. TaxID=1720 RepID=UPI0026DAC5B3|nr:hypothetical protein [Corynebacterium sp.]MDO5097378.1 hypothetical protein [Corynebacterium sp.]